LTKLTPGRIVLGSIGFAIGIIGVLSLREATLSTHQPVASRGTEIVVSARTHGAERGQTLGEMVEAQLLTCRLEVTSDFGGSIEPQQVGEGRFRARLVPGLDETNRRQFRGCVEDFMIDHLQIDVIDMTQIT
jgi:hypothetical protein